jgi:hypothetical protein
MWNVFEQPWTMLVTAVVVFFVMQIVCMAISKKRRWLAIGRFALPAFIALLGLGLDYFVQTDLEQIKALIKTSVKAVENEDCDIIESLISENYRDSFHSGKAALMAHCRTVLIEPLIEKNVLHLIEIKISPPKATAVFTVRIMFDKQSEVYQSFKHTMLVKVKLDFQKELVRPKPKVNWLISSVELLEIDMQPVSWGHIVEAAGGGW